MFEESRSCVCFFLFHLKHAATERELAVSEAPSKTETGHGEWCLFMTHFYLQSGGREKCKGKRERLALTRGELCGDTRQRRVVVRKTR